MATDELIQIVDDKDRPIGSAPMSQAWKEGLIHRVSRVMVEDDKGKVLLQKRSHLKETHPNCWGNSAAGYVDAGESYEETARRELAEELGIENVPIREIGYFYADTTFKTHRMKRFVRIYKTIVNETPTKLQASEVSEVRWLSIPEIKKLIKAHPDQVEDGLEQIFQRFY